MQPTESIEEFYKRVFRSDGGNFTLNNTGSGHFNVFPRDVSCRKTPYSRRDFYKVSLVLGTGRLCYGDKWIELDKPALLSLPPECPTHGRGLPPNKKAGIACSRKPSFNPARKMRPCRIRRFSGRGRCLFFSSTANNKKR